MRVLLPCQSLLAAALGVALLSACSSSTAGSPDGGDETGSTDSSVVDGPDDATAADGATDGPAGDSSDSGAADSGADADAGEAGQADSGTDATDSGGLGSDSGGDASDGGSPSLDGGPLAAGTYACATCPGSAKYCNGVCYDSASAGPDVGCGDPAVCACSTANAVPTCKAGKCAVLTCDPDYADCDGMASNGCETNLRTFGNCGGCGVVCTASQVCTPTGCAATCSPPLTNCSGICVDLTTDPLFCGSCTSSCTSSGGSVATCSNGTCGTTCAAGLTDCNGSCVDLASDPGHCGSCTTSCLPAPSGGQVACTQSQCATLCPPGTQLCGTACVVGSLDPANCGACGRACTGTDVCVLGTCAPRLSTVVASGLSGVVSLAVDASNVYFVDGAGVHAAPRAGGTVKDLAPATGKPLRVAVDGTYAYWSENLGGAIMRAPKDGSGSPALVSAATQPQGLVVVGSTVYWVSNATNDESIHQAAANGGTATVFTTVSDQGHIADGLFELVSDGASLFVASEYAAYSIPILANGTAGTPVTVVGGGTGMVVGEIAGRSNEFCGMWSGLSGIGYTCQTGGFNFFPGENPGPFVLPTCGIVFSTKYGTATQFVPHLVADRDLYTGQRSQQTLTTDDVGPLITDGTNVYFFETGGSIRWLPIP